MPQKKVNRDAATGKFVPDKKAKAKANPKTTYQQTVEPKSATKKKDKKKK